MTADAERALLAQAIATVPKAELHCHYMGTVRHATLVEIAGATGIELPPSCRDGYRFASFPEFLEVFDTAGRAITREEDLARVAYEALEDGLNDANVIHRELHVEVQAHVRAGVPFRRVLDGVTAGIRRAHRTLGVTSRVLVALDRGTTSAEEAVEFVKQTVDYGDELVCGLALSGAEGDGPPERFAAAFQLAEREGLRRANHVCEDNQPIERAPAANYLTSRDLLRCERYDHGNNLVSDPEVLADAARDGAVFNVVTFTSAEGRRASRRASIRVMKDAGLRLTVNSDDPAMFGVTVRDCYQTLFDESGWGLDELREMIENGFEASWLSETERRAALARVDAAFTALA